MKISEIKVSYSLNNQKKPKVKTSMEAYGVLIDSWDSDIIELQEEFKLLLLNGANKILGVYHLSKGGTSSTIVDNKLIFSVALKCQASGIILAHNHPSGSLYPSEADKQVTRKVKKGGECLDIKLLDHLIITKDGYFSFADEGLL